MTRMSLAFVIFAISLSFAALSASAQEKKTSPTAAEKSPTFGTTRVAIVNVGVVFTKYERASAFKGGLDDLLRQPKQDAMAIVSNIKIWESALRGGNLPPGKKELYEEKIISAKRKLEDLDRNIKLKIGKTQENNLVVLWKDVRQAVKEYANQHGIDLVIAYGDPLQKELLDLFPNVNRKMQAMDHGSAIPFFIGSNVDISEQVAAHLNEQFREKDNDGK